MNLNNLIDSEVELRENQITRYEKIYGAAKEYETVILENLKPSIDNNLDVVDLSLINEKVKEVLYVAILMLARENA